MNIDLLLIEVNNQKLGGYNSIPFTMAKDLVGYIYEDNVVVKNSLINVLKNNTDRRGNLNADFLQNRLGCTNRYLGSSENNSRLKMLYFNALTKNTYAEVVFFIFILGLANCKDLLKSFRDIDFLFSKLVVYSRKVDRHKTTSLVVSREGYCKVMLALIENTSEGIDYGFSVYDFVYHILQNTKEAYVASKLLSRLKINDWSCFSLEGLDLAKYSEEICIMLPYTMGNVDMCEQDVILAMNSAPTKLLRVALTSQTFNSKVIGGMVTERIVGI